MKDRVLITGGTGYLGSRIALALGREGVFQLRLGIHPGLPSSTSWMERFEVGRLDVLSDEQGRAACDGVKAVIHLAALNQKLCDADPEQALLVNSLGTLKLLRGAQLAGVKRFIYFSTAHVYGSPLMGTITEKTLARPVHPYAISHRTAEDFVLGARERGLLEGLVFRLSNGIGAPVHPDISQWMLIGNDLCRQAATSGKLVLKTSGLQRRDWIPLGDVARAVAHVLVLPDSECQDGLFNLGGECSLRIIDLAERIAGRCIRVLGFKPEIIHPDPLPGEVSHPLDYCIDKLKATGFRLQGELDEEIDTTLRFCKTSFAYSS